MKKNHAYNDVMEFVQRGTNLGYFQTSLQMVNSFVVLMVDCNKIQSGLLFWPPSCYLLDKPL